MSFLKPLLNGKNVNEMKMTNEYIKKNKNGLNFELKRSLSRDIVKKNTHDVEVFFKRKHRQTHTAIQLDDHISSVQCYKTKYVWPQFWT